MVIENMTFELGGGVEADDFIAADVIVQEHFFHQQPGLVRRTLARNDDQWLVLTSWGSDDEASAAADAFAAADLSTDFNAMIDESTLDVRQYSPARR